MDYFVVESLNIDLVKIQVTGCWYRQALVGVVISRPSISLHMGWGVQKVFYFLCFGILKIHHLKGIDTLNVVHI